MNPVITFLYGLVLLFLLGWYLVSENERIKRWLGTVLTILFTAFCIWSANPPLDVKDQDGVIKVHGKIHLGLDLQGGTSFLIRLEPLSGEGGEKREVTKDMVDQAMEAIRKRVDQFGVSEPIITPQGGDRILVQIPGLDAEKIKEAREQLKKVAKLEFRLVHPDSARLVPLIESGQEVLPIGYAIEAMNYERNGKQVEGKLLIKKKADLTGEHVTRAGAFYDARGWGVHLNFDSEGANKFGELTKQVFEEHSQMAIVLDGKVISAPGVEKGPIYGGSAAISGGNMSEKEARNLASALQNPLQTPVKIMEERQVSATLGSDSIKSGIYSGVAGLILVALFMMVYYRLVGFIAIIALLINCLMVIGALAMFNSVLTLPGIAGLILSLGIAIDANVLIYERLREELDAGKSLKAAIDSSYRKAFSAIFDAHVTQFLTAALLFWLASGPVKGFALTLTVGIVASMFSSLLITYTCFSWAFRFHLLDRVTMLHLIRSKFFDFLGNARPFIVVSSALVILSIGVLIFRGDRALSADFKGGDLLVLSAAQKLSPDQVRKALAGTGFENSVIQAEHVADRDLISIRSDESTADRIKAHLSQELPSVGLKFEQTDHVGSLVGKELATKSALALILGMVGIFVYVSARFETSFAVGSLLALAHDLLITLGIFALSGRELSLIMVGALLTIAGYSINDKIVVFDRIREGLHSGRAGSVQSIMNASINETLSRTILTGGTVLLTILALYFFGGPVLNDFAFSFLIGVVVGTYSSIFIAAPIVLWWSGHKGGSLRTEVKQAAPAAA